MFQFESIEKKLLTFLEYTKQYKYQISKVNPKGLMKIQTQSERKIVSAEDYQKSIDGIILRKSLKITSLPHLRITRKTFNATIVLLVLN